MAIFVFVSLNNKFSASARRAAFEADRTRYMSDILRITNGVMPVLWIDPKYSYRSASKYFDLSGNGNHGTQGTGANQPTVNPPGLEFDGVDDYLDCGTGITIGQNDNFTYEAWVYSKTDNWGKAFIMGGTSQANYSFYAWHTATHDGPWLYLAIEDSADRILESGCDSSMNQWYHMVLTRDGDTYKIYMDGVLCPNSYTYDTATSMSHLYIGHSGDNVRNFHGTIGSVRVYDIELSATQIQNLYLAGLPAHRD